MLKFTIWWYFLHNMMARENFHEMLLREIGVPSNLVSYQKKKPARFVETVTLCKNFHRNFKRKLSSSLCYHMISVGTCFSVSICLMFWFVYLAYCCFCAMLLSISHLSIVNIFCCLYYMPGVYQKSHIFCLQFLWLNDLL